MQKKFGIKKQLFILFIILEVNSFMFSEIITKRIGRNFFSLDMDTLKIDITNYHNLKTNDENNYGSQRTINDKLLATLKTNKKSKASEYIIFDCQTGNIIETYSFYNSKPINGNIREYFFTNNSIYTVIDERIIKRTLDGDIIMNKIIDDSEFNQHTLVYFLIDEQNEVAICEFNCKGNKQRVCIYSLNDKFRFKEYYGKLLLKMTKETNKLYYSDSNTIYCIDYKENFNTTKIKVKKPLSENIIELVEFENEYIMITKKNYFESFTTNIVFGNESFHNYYYLCCLDNDKLKIQKKVYEDDEEPRIFWK